MKQTEQACAGGGRPVSRDFDVAAESRDAEKLRAAKTETYYASFDKITDRRNTNAEKWLVGDGELPMWVADMDFPTAPAVRAAIERRAAHGIFGYAGIPDAWYEAYGSWWGIRHHFPLRREWLVFCTGVVQALSSVVRKLTTPAEKVLIQPPVYHMFYNCILNNGRFVAENPLIYENGSYRVDFEDLEEKLSDPQTTLMILCNPHNPIGKIWDRETLFRIGQLCRKHHVTVVSDEIHCDLTDPGKEYVPFASVSEDCRENSVTCLAPTKTFNLAGLQTAAVSVPNEALFCKVRRGLNTDEVAEPNAFAIDGAVAAFTEGGEWLDALRRYLYENKRFAASFLADELPRIRLVPSEATYLLWLDGTALGQTGLAERIRRETGLYLSDGAPFGGNGASFLRMNIACPRATLEHGLNRLRQGVAALTRG